MMYHIIYDVKHDPFNSLAEKRILAVSSFSDALADRFTKFLDETSIFKKLSWLNHRIWISIIKPELFPVKTKEAAMKLTKYRSDVENLLQQFQVMETLFCYDCWRNRISVRKIGGEQFSGKFYVSLTFLILISAR